MKNLVERADKDKDDKVEIEEILAFDDFEFVELAYNVFVELGNPGERLSYLVKHKVLGTLPNYSIFTSSASRTSHQLHYGVALFLLNLYLCTFHSSSLFAQTGGRCWGGCGREESEALVATWLTALQVVIKNITCRVWHLQSFEQIDLLCMYIFLIS